MAMPRDATAFRKFTSNRMVRAVGLSLLLHVFIVGVGELGHRLGFWQFTLQPLSFKDLHQRSQMAAAQSQEPEFSLPVVFVEVDPAQEAQETPSDTQYYSDRTTRAANPDTRNETETPKIAGNQDKVVHTMDRARAEPPAPPPIPPPQPRPEPPQPAPLQPAPLQPAQAEPQPLQPDLSPPGLPPGQLVEAAPPEPPKPTSAVQEPIPPQTTRIRRLADLMPQGHRVQERMHQEGGVRRFSIESTLDVRATPFGSYDAAFIAAVEKRWNDLLNQRDYARNLAGKVVLDFRLNSDGRITEMRVRVNEVSEILALICQRAVQDPAPYAPWPADMRRMIGADYRDVRFTFHYN